MNGADAFNLATGALCRSLKRIEEYDEDPDSYSEDILEDVRAMCEDTLDALKAAGFQVASC